MKFKFLSMLLALSVIPVTNAYANDEYETGQVVISASRMEQEIDDVSANIDVITAEEIQKGGFTNVSDIFGAQLNVSSGRPSIRALGANYTLFLIDGRRPVGSENGGDGSGSFLSSININNIERIEIIKGAAATMYGSDAMGGVVNIITKKSVEPSGAMTISLSNLTAMTNYYYDFGRVGKWTGKIDANFSQDLGYKTRSGAVDTETNNGDWVESQSKYDELDVYSTNGLGYEYSLGASLGYYFNDNHEVLASYSYQKQREISLAYGVDGSAVGEDLDWQVSLNTKNHTFDYHNAGINFTGSFGDHSYTFMPTFAMSLAEGVNSSAKAYWFIDTGFTAIDTFPINDWNLISVGADYKLSLLDHSSRESSGLDSFADPMHKAGAFLQDEVLLLNEKLILLPSIRFDYGTMSNPQFTARFGTTYEFLPDQRFKFNVGNAYRTPNLNELAGAETKSTSYTITNGYLVVDGQQITDKDTDGNKISLADGTYSSGVTYGNTDLEAETAINVDARYEGKFGNLSTSIGGYYIAKDNAIATSDVFALINEGDGEYRSVNERYNVKGISNYSGLEAEASLEFANYFNANLGYAYMNNWHEEDYRLGGYATHTLTGSLGFDYPDWDMFASVSGNFYMNYRGSADSTTGTTEATSKGVTTWTVADNALREYNYYNVNLAIGKIFKDKYTIVASADNILRSGRQLLHYATKYSDEACTTPISTSPYTYQTVSPATRTYKLTFTAAF